MIVYFVQDANTLGSYDEENLTKVLKEGFHKYKIEELTFFSRQLKSKLVKFAELRFKSVEDMNLYMAEKSNEQRFKIADRPILKINMLSKRTN